MTKTTRIHDIEKVIHGNKVKTSFIAAPHTQIVNEQGQARRIPDLENNLKAQFGVERVMTKAINKINNEFGPSGYVVSEASNKDSRIRFVGNGWGTYTDTHGTRPYTNIVGDFLEITFYGTGLNLVTIGFGTRDWRVTVDGGAEGGNIFGTVSTILAGRNYTPNGIIPVVSGLSLGIHTVKVRNVASNIDISGCEILNETTQVVVNSGQPLVGGFAASLSAQSLLDLSPAAIAGTKGGRVVTYITESGSLGQAVTEVDVTPQYLASADHTNEEVVRNINFREFGRNRADDFSTLTTTTSDRAFTLDDGTTTLTGNDVRIQSFTTSHEALCANNGTGFFFTLTFVGTGLDVTYITDVIARSMEIFIDGVSVGITNDSSAVANFSKKKICSGLPYGTHTVKFKNNSGLDVTQGIGEFIIYQPKKPALPENSVEIADYNVMADFVANSTNDVDYISQGTVRKVGTREMKYVGANWQAPVLNPLSLSGFSFYTLTNTEYVEYTFFGTGFDYRLRLDNAADAVMSIDGSTDLSSFTTSSYGVTTFTPSTGAIVGPGNSFGSGIVVSGLPLGLHTVRITKGASVADAVGVYAFDVICPIHINSKDFKTGSLSLADMRADQSIEGASSKNIDLGKAKAWALIDSVNNKILESYNIAAYINESAGTHHVYTKHPFKNKENIIAHITNADTSTRIIFYKATSPEHILILSRSDAGGAVLPGIFAITVFGELENEEDISLEDL